MGSIDRLKRNLEQVEQRIALAAQVAGRNREGIRLLAVTKSVGHNVVRDLLNLGYKHLGENRPETMDARRIGLSDMANEPTWHMIGPYQRRKIAHTLHHFEWVHSVHKESLLSDLNKFWPSDRPPLRVLLQVNPANDPNKQGLTEDHLKSILDVATSHSRIRVEGLMAMAPANQREGELRRLFSHVREMRDRVCRNDIPLSELSMGMSQDFEAAILEGATIIRLGSVLFEGVEDEGIDAET
ncbi:MAG TPA: YggS family pyridoxal phosphate-dependent enzyme [Planctomycetota bacterium]|nr:YggS family pyridoxal phosphate-dependent enzyme [Planctomycetota bacterium]